jgi:hypothetical protein
LAEKHFGKLRLGSPRMRYKFTYNIKTGIRQMGYDDRKFMHYFRMVSVGELGVLGMLKL